MSRQKAGQRDRQTLFHRILPDTAGGSTSTTVVDWHLTGWQIRDIQYDVCLTKNCCITISIQKISSIHKFMLKIKQILGSHELKCHGQLWRHPPKNHWTNFYLSGVCTSMQKLCLFYLLILEIQSILESCYQTGHIHFWPCLTKICLIHI